VVQVGVDNWDLINVTSERCASYTRGKVVFEDGLIAQVIGLSDTHTFNRFDTGRLK